VTATVFLQALLSVLLLSLTFCHPVFSPAAPSSPHLWQQR